MAIAGEPFLVPCSRGLRKLVRRPDCRRCDQPFSLYWKVYSAISKMVWRIFVACLCQKLAACCIGTGDPRATLRIFQLSTATHCTVNWVKLKRVVNLLVWFQIPNINNYKPKQYSTHLFIFSWDGPFQGFYVQSLSCVVSDDVLWQRTQNTCHMLIWKTSDYLQPPLSPFPVSHHDLVCSVWFCQQRTRRCSFCSHMMYKPPNCYFVDWVDLHLVQGHHKSRWPLYTL